jgi:hypothetical protein
LIIHGKLERRFLDAGEGFGDGEEELSAQSRALVLIPVVRLLEVGISGGERGNLPGHADLAARRRRKVSRQGVPGWGLRWSSAKAWSRISISLADGAVPWRIS